MVKVRSTASKQPKDRLTLDRRLRLHKRMQPTITWLNRTSWIFTVLSVGASILLVFADRHSQSLWPFLGIGIYILLGGIVLALSRAWWTNVAKIAAYDDIATVAPLLDFADATFARHDRKEGTPMPKSEAIVLPHLPVLLERMPAGDGPALTASQRSALVRMVCSPLYEKHFRSPGLRAQIDAMTEKR